MEYISDIFIYFLVFVISAVFVYSGLSIYKKNKLGFLLVLIGILIPSIMAGIRYGVGMDYPAYLNMYNNVVDDRAMYFRSIEPASVAIINISAYFQSSVLMFFSFSFITNLVFLFSFWKIFGKNSKRTTLAFFFFLCIMFSTTLNAVRTGASIAFVTLAFSYLISDPPKKSILKSLFFIIVACLFHRSALLALPFVLPFIFAWKNSGKYILAKKIGLWGLYLIVAIFLPFIFPEWREFSLVGDYSRYLKGFNGDFSIPLADIAMFGVIIWTLIYFYKNMKAHQNERLNRLFYCAIFYIPLSASVGWLTYADGLSRISFLLEPLVICLVVYLAAKPKKIFNLLDLIAVIVIIVVTGLMFIRNLTWSGALPYRTVFHEEIAYVSKN